MELTPSILLQWVVQLLAGIAFSGFLGATWGAPLLAVLFAKLRGGRGGESLRLSSSPGKVTLEFLVPAHNEERMIGATLESIRRNLRLPEVASGVEASLTVGLDHCKDGTRNLVQAFGRELDFPVTAMFHNGRPGKWNVLKALVEQSRAEWVALVDSGSVWEENLLARTLPLVRDSQVMGIAPSYSPSGGGTLERLFWRLEQQFKTIESLSGGPVSVHGASVLYRREKLVAALRALEGKEWLNDDVVVPFTLRLNFPESRIVYVTKPGGEAWVGDIGIENSLEVESRRRNRMVVGNLQWMSQLLLPALLTRPFSLVALVSLRRLFRVFWAYWLAALGACAVLLPLLVFGQGLLSVGISFGSVVVTTLALGTRSNFARRVFVAFVSSLRIPLVLANFRKHRGVSWA